MEDQHHQHSRCGRHVPTAVGVSRHEIYAVQCAAGQAGLDGCALSTVTAHVMC